MAEVPKTGDAVGRGSWRSSFLGAPGAEFLRETSARKNFLGRGRRRPRPKIPRILGRRKENSSYSMCAQENCLTRGVHPSSLCPILCPIIFRNGSDRLTNRFNCEPLSTVPNVPVSFRHSHRSARAPSHDCCHDGKRHACFQHSRASGVA